MQRLPYAVDLPSNPSLATAPAAKISGNVSEYSALDGAADDAMEITTVVFFLLAFVCAMAWNVLYPRFLGRLRTHHADVWDQLGRPKYIELRFAPALAALRFLLQRHYQPMEDKSLVSLAAWSRIALIGTVVGMALAFAFIAIVVASKP
jgi:hypothetical protein